MGNNQDNYENDPYIKQSQNNVAYRNLYTNSSLVPLNEMAQRDELNVKQITNQQETKKTQAYKNPIKLEKDSLLLERDIYNPSIFYISFKYSCEKVIYSNFYFNASFNPNSMISFTPSPNFSNIIKLSLAPGNNLECKDSSLNINIDYFLANKNYDKRLTDLVIELFTVDNTGQNAECIMATFCKILYNKNNQKNNFELKFICQKCKIMNSQWYNLEEIYGLTTDENLCEICYTNPRNTFFMPCKHSFACKECAVLLRIKNKGCPICRQPISDSIVLENANEINN